MNYLNIEKDSDRIKYVRQTLQLYQYELAEKLNCAQTLISAYEKEKLNFSKKFECEFLQFCEQHEIYFKPQAHLRASQKVKVKNLYTPPKPKKEQKK